MWFTKEQFEICNELRSLGLEPRFEVGDVVARGFADLGFEEYQILPGEKLLSLTAGTASVLPHEHKHHFFWIPSVDEVVSIMERSGAEIVSSERLDRRTWRVRIAVHGTVLEVESRSLHQALLSALLRVTKAQRSVAEAV